MKANEISIHTHTYTADDTVDNFIRNISMADFLKSMIFILKLESV